MRTTRSLATLLGSLLLAGFAVLGTAGSASAEDYYRYWAYFTVTDGEFDYQETESPGTYVPEDGSIEGYRYVASGLAMKHAPRADLSEVTFEAICDDVEPVEGEKRVAVVIDFGAEQDAPEGKDVPEPLGLCAQVPADAVGMAVLNDVAEANVVQGALQDINGYPGTGEAFPQVDAASPADAGPVAFDLGEDASSSEDDEDGNLPLLIGAGVVVVLLAGGGVALARRNRSAA